MPHIDALFAAQESAETAQALADHLTAAVKLANKGPRRRRALERCLMNVADLAEQLVPGGYCHDSPHGRAMPSYGVIGHA